jgi:hypothetical protein
VNKMDRPERDAPHRRQRVHLAAAIVQLRPARPGAVAERQQGAAVRLGEIEWALTTYRWTAPKKVTGYLSLRGPKVDVQATDSSRGQI